MIAVHPGGHSKVTGLLLFNCLSLFPLEFFLNMCVLFFKMKIEAYLEVQLKYLLRSS